MPKRQKKSHPAKVSIGNRKRSGKTKRMLVVASLPRRPRHVFLDHAPKATPQFMSWLRAAVRNPFDVKPPAIGSHGAPTSVVRLQSRTIIPVTATGSLRFAYYPTAAPLIYVTTDPTVTSGTGTIVSATGATTLTTFFSAGRPICGAVRFTSINPSTAVPGYWTGMQQAGGFVANSWVSGGGTFRPASELTAAAPMPPSPMTSGRWEYINWKHEDPTDFAFEHNDLAATIATTRPVCIATINGASTSNVSWIIETITWSEVKYVSSAAPIFGKDAVSMNEAKAEEKIDAVEDNMPSVSAASLNDYTGVLSSIATATGHPLLGTGLKIVADHLGGANHSGRK